MAFYETVLVKGYETLVDSGTRVEVNTGMIAAARLQALTESRASGTRIADLMAQMGHIINAVHSTVPEELWPEILRKIDGPVAADMPADEFEDWGDAEDEYDPVESAQADEDCWIQRAARADHPGTNGGASRTSDESPSIAPSTRELRGERVTLAGRGARLDALGHPHLSGACKPREIKATTLTVHGYRGAPSRGEC